MPPRTQTPTPLGNPRTKTGYIELYLNEVFYGTNAYGIHDAAVTFFNTTPDSLSLPRAAMLIGQINAPTAYNPLRHPQRATTRMQHVFDRMVASGFLDPATRREYAAPPHRRAHRPRLSASQSRALLGRSHQRGNRPAVGTVGPALAEA